MIDYDLRDPLRVPLDTTREYEIVVVYVTRQGTRRAMCLTRDDLKGQGYYGVLDRVIDLIERYGGEVEKYIEVRDTTDQIKKLFEHVRKTGYKTPRQRGC